MGGHVLWIAFAVAVQFSTVLGRNHFYEYYYSRYHHKDHSSTTAIPSHALDHSSTTALSSQESDTSSEEVIASVSAEYYTTVEPAVVQSGNSYYDDDDWQRTYSLRVGIIVGCFLVFVTCSCCIFCCLRMCCRRNAGHAGIIIRIPRETAHEIVAQPRIFTQQQQPPLAVQQHQQQMIAQQHPPPEAQHYQHMQQFPPQYQSQPVPQQYPPAQAEFHHSPAGGNYHNPPEAPPPYEFPNKF